MKRETSMIAGMRLQIQAVFRDPGALLLLVLYRFHSRGHSQSGIKEK